jgi:hypothetical protein
MPVSALYDTVGATRQGRPSRLPRGQKKKGLNEGRVQSKEQDDVGPTIYCNAVGPDR